MKAGRDVLRVVVVDDEALAREDVVHLLNCRDDVAVVASCATGREALAAVRQLRPDVLLLDVRMPGLDGFHVVEKLDPECMPHIVFLSAYDHYAVEAFRVRALDYVLKPVQPKRLADALARARELLPMREASKRYWKEILVRTGGRDLVVRVNDIEWVEADTYYVRLHVNGRSYLLRERMHILEAHLDPRGFARVHRSAIVNVAHVREIRHAEGGEHFVVLSSGRQIRTSRPRWPAFREALRLRRAVDIA